MWESVWSDVGWFKETHHSSLVTRRAEIVRASQCLVMNGRDRAHRPYGSRNDHCRAKAFTCRPQKEVQDALLDALLDAFYRNATDDAYEVLQEVPGSEKHSDLVFSRAAELPNFMEGTIIIIILKINKGRNKKADQRRELDSNSRFASNAPHSHKMAYRPKHSQQFPLVFKAKQESRKEKKERRQRT